MIAGSDRRGAAYGLLEISNNTIVITNEGRLLIRNICMLFDGHMKSPDLKTKFSKMFDSGTVLTL